MKLARTAEDAARTADAAQRSGIAMRLRLSFTRALQTALERLEPQEKEKAPPIYAEEKTLAELGRLRGEHESSVSRHLDRDRADYASVGRYLRTVCGSANGARQMTRDAGFMLPAQPSDLRASVFSSA